MESVSNVTTEENAISGYTVVFATLVMLIILIGTIFGLIGSAFICISVYRVKSLKTPVNNLVCNMAVVSFLCSVTSLPLLTTLVCHSILYPSSDTLYTMEILTQVEMAFFVLYTCVQVITLLCISLERYQAIAKPFEKSKRAKRVKVALVVTWSLSTAICLTYIVSDIYRDSLDTSYLAIVLIENTTVLYVFLPFTLGVLALIIVLYLSIVRLIRLHIQKTERKLTKTNKVAPTASSVVAQAERDVARIQASARGKKQSISHTLAVVSAENTQVTTLPTPDIEHTTPATETEASMLVLKDNGLNCNDKVQNLPQNTLGTNMSYPENDKQGGSMGYNNSLETDKAENGTDNCPTATEPTITPYPQIPEMLKELENEILVASGNPEATTRPSVLSTVEQDMPSSTHEGPSTQVQEPSSKAIDLRTQEQGEPQKPVESLASPKPADNDNTETSAVEMVVSIKKKNVVDVVDAAGNVAKVATEGEVSGAICVMNNTNREQGRRRIEVRTAKLAGLVILVFVTLWLPCQLFILYLHISGTNIIDTSTGWGLVLVFQALAFCAVMVSPFVFALVSKDLRREIIRMGKKVMTKCNARDKK